MLLKIEEIITEFRDYGMLINETFLDHDIDEVAVVLHVRLLLEAAAHKPIKLTANGYLPTKLVEAIVKAMPTPSEARYLGITKRFLEQEQMVAMRARALCDIGGLLRKKKGTLELSKKGKAFLEAKRTAQFLFVLHTHLSFNIAYLDGMQPSTLINDIQLPCLQLLRDKDRLFRASDVFAALLFDASPEILHRAIHEILPESYDSEDAEDEFVQLMELRLFQRYLVPFGLAIERGIAYKEQYECQKSELCDLLIAPQNAINYEYVPNKKRVRALKQRIGSEKLEVALFEDFTFLLSTCMVHPLPSAEQMAEQLVTFRRFIGTAAQKHHAFYIDLAHSALEFIRLFTQLDGKGKREDLKKEFQSTIEGLLFMADQEKPFALFKTYNTMPEYFVMWFAKYYGINADEEMSRRVLEAFNQEVLEDIGTLFVIINDLQKATRKSKRINEKIRLLSHDAVVAFVMAIMSVYTYRLEND